MFTRNILISLLVCLSASPAFCADGPFYVVNGNQITTVVYAATPVARLSTGYAYGSPVMAVPMGHAVQAPVLSQVFGTPIQNQLVYTAYPSSQTYSYGAPVVYPYSAPAVQIQSGFTYGSPVVYTRFGY